MFLSHFALIDKVTVAIVYLFADCAMSKHNDLNQEVEVTYLDPRPPEV